MPKLVATHFRNIAAAAFVCLVATAGIARSDDAEIQTVAGIGDPGGKIPRLQICPESASDPDTYALCFTAKCWTLDEVAYCKCDLKNGESISLPFEYREGRKKKDVCDIFLESVDNGFTVSTYSPPRQMLKGYKPTKEKLGPPMALYNCPGDSNRNDDYSAQCDGGLCFNSSSGTEFPGLGPIGEDEIVCSCPPIPNVPIGFQIAGPWSCDPGDRNANGQCCDATYQDKYCNVASTDRTGTQMVVSAPTGFAEALGRKLTGKVPRFNHCE